MATYVEIWTWKAPMQAAVDKLDLTGYDVEAADGHIGKIDEASKEAGASSIVVDTGWWIFGKKRMLPASVVERVDIQDEKVFIRCNKDQVKDAPDYEESTRDEPSYRDKVGDYWSRS